MKPTGARSPGAYGIFLYIASWNTIAPLSPVTMV